MATHPRGESNRLKTRSTRGESIKLYVLSNVDELYCETLNRAANNLFLQLYT